MRVKIILSLWLLISTLLAITQTSFAKQIFVDTNAAGNNDGSSWDNAYNFLQDALADASNGDEILVAQGIYKPDQGKAVKPKDRGATFQLINSVTIKGGYAGHGKPNSDERNIETYKTILSGDLNGDDEPSFANSNDNSYNVVTAFGTNTTAVLDGFTITAGNANSNGGGMHNHRASPTIKNCTFIANSAFCGAGIYNDLSNPVLLECTFIANSAGDCGGGVYNSTSSPILTNCIFLKNSALNGGAIYCKHDSSPILNNCTFTENSARYSGAKANYLNSNPTLKSCKFAQNSANHGGAMRNYNSNPTLTNCTFNNNSASGDGGAMNNNSSNPTLTCCIFSGNSTGSYGGAMRNHSSSPRLIGCTISENSVGGYGGGISNHENSNPILTNCILWQNSDVGTDPESAQIYTSASTPVINYCCIQGYSGIISGIGNIDKDPLFEDPVNGNFHLLPNSPCINSGDANYVAADKEADIDGEPRVINDCLDIGADEYNNLRLVPGKYPTIQAAINAAYYGDIVVISPGAYTGTGNRNIDFKGKAIIFRSTDPKDRNIVVATIINCENDGRGFYFHSGEDANSVVDGLTILNGNAVNGGGIYCKDSSPTLSNCIIRNNSSKNSGGGMYNENSEPTLNNCTFSNNLAQYGGGGIHNYNSTPTIINCMFKENLAKYGGAVYNSGGSSPVLRHCMFSMNSTTEHGGGMDSYDSYPKLTNCTFNKNLTNGNGGGIFNQSGNITLTNCSFFENEAGDNGGGLTNLYGTVTMTDCKFARNTSNDHGGGMFNRNSSPILANCTFTANTSYENGGGVYNRDGSPTLVNCILSGNLSKNNGGAMYNDNSPMLTNCTFTGNSARTGSGLYNDSCSYQCRPKLNNCIFWDNRDIDNFIIPAQIYGDSPVVSYCCIQNTDPNDPNVYQGTSNINDNPCFVKPGYWSKLDNTSIQVKPDDPNAVWVDGDYHLLLNSPCIDAGDPASDYSLEPQPNGGRINIGAYGNTPEAASKGKETSHLYTPQDKVYLRRTLAEYYLILCIRLT